MFHSDTLHDTLLLATWLYWSHALHVQGVWFQLKYFFNQVSVGGHGAALIGVIKNIAFLQSKYHRVYGCPKPVLSHEPTRQHKCWIPPPVVFTHPSPCQLPQTLESFSPSVGSLPQWCHTLPLPTPWIPLTQSWLCQLGEEQLFNPSHGPLTVFLSDNYTVYPPNH